MLKQLTAACFAVTAMTASASATTFVFKGDGNNVTPEGVIDVDYVACASEGDFCSIDKDDGGHSDGLSYILDGIALQVIAYAGGDGTGTANLGTATRLIQDINPSDSGLGAFSEDNDSDDQTQFGRGESVEFIFDGAYNVTDVEFNAGGDVDCTVTSDGSGEGPCGEVLIEVFDLEGMVMSRIVDMTNRNTLAFLGQGVRFVLTALTPGGGFTIAQMTVSDIPIPGALPLLISGLAGLGFASRRRKKAA